VLFRSFLTAERIGAEEMKAIGFLTHLVGADALSATADALTTELNSMAPLAMLGMKKALNRMATGRLDVAEMQADIERTLQSADLQEGRAAFAQRRSPSFTGR